MARSRELSDTKVELNKEKLEKAEELTGKLTQQKKHEKLMNSVIENDKETIDNGKLLNDSINAGLGSFTPDIIFEKFVKDYSLAKHIYGEKIIHALSGFDPDFIEKNVNIPEFQRELQKKIAERVESLKEKKLVNRDYIITDDGYTLASLVLYTQELDRLAPKGLIGEKLHKKEHIYGEKQDIRAYKKEDMYKNIAVRKTVQTAIKRGHKKPDITDFKSHTRKSKGRVYVVYALDSSGSMKGSKIENCKKAGVALAFKAIEEKDKVGLMIFGKDVDVKIEPTSDFPRLLDEMTKIRAFNETDLANTIKNSIEMFPSTDATRHLMLITDALPTAGKYPEEDALEAAGIACAAGITISVIGINLDEKGKALAEKIVQIGQGRLYAAKETEDIDLIVLEDYYSA